MLVTCPECGARYEIDGSLIPAAGRSVQCTACDHVWLQPAAGAADGDDAEGAEVEAPRARPPLPEEVKSILREEARREAQARRERGLVDVPAEPALAAGAPVSRPRAHVSTGPLPDVDAINATLRAASERAAEAQGRLPRPGRRGFAVGLFVGLALVGLGALAYAAAPRIAEAVPTAAPTLELYVETVDDLRVRLDAAAARVTATVSNLLPSGG